MMALRQEGNVLVFLCACVLLFALSCNAQDNCMELWLKASRLPSSLHVNLWQAKLDESTIPQANPGFLRFVLRSEHVKEGAGLVHARRALLDCMSGRNASCRVKLPCRNGGRCLHRAESNSFSCFCQTPYGGDFCDVDLSSSQRCILQRNLTSRIQQMQKQLSAQTSEITDVLNILKAEHTSVIPTITTVCARTQTIRGSGVYRIKLPDVQAFTAFCDMDTDTNSYGYLVFQRREDGSVNFYRDYATYVKGFGNPKEEYWMGLELLHRLSSAYQVEMRVDLGDWEGNKAYAKYSSFRIGDATSGYRINISGYSGNAGDAMIYTNGQQFSTRDHDVDTYHENCAVKYRGAWWYNRCHKANLNSVYERATVTSYANTVVWQQWKGFHYSLKFTEMKIRITPTTSS